MGLRHVSDDEGECWCADCTKRLTDAHGRLLQDWIERDKARRRRAPGQGAPP
jgi:hypothetical protein